MGVGSGARSGSGRSPRATDRGCRSGAGAGRPQDVDVSRAGVGKPEPPGRIVLVLPGVQPQRIVAVTAEAHVGEPRPPAPARAHDERQMIERRGHARPPLPPPPPPAPPPPPPPP